jgi:hypothetical protein
MAEHFGIGRVLEFGVIPYAQLYFVFVYGYPLGILYIYYVRTVMRLLRISNSLSGLF